MRQDSERWTEVSRSAFDHEKQGLALLAGAVPDSSPYRVWANFEFQDSHGQWHEVDALVVGQSRIHLLELKSYHGRLGGDEHLWVTERRGRVDRMRSPMVATRRKAQRFKSRLEEEISKIARDPENTRMVREAAAKFGRIPWIQEAVFLHNPAIRSSLPPGKAHNIFGVDPADFPFETLDTGLPPISERIQEPSGGSRINELQELVIAVAMQSIAGIAVRDQYAGSFLLHDRLDSPDPRFHEWDGEHKETGDPIRARVLNLDSVAHEGQRLSMRKNLRREYELLAGLNHQHIVSPRSMETLRGTSEEVVVYPALPEYQPLDVALPGARLSAAERAEIVHQVASAVLYAHQHQVVHRGLDPATVLLNVERVSSLPVDRPGRIEVKVDGWSRAGTTEASGTVLGATGSAVTSVSVDDATAVFQAPEASGMHTPDRLAADLFSLGAVAYYVLTGAEPASDRSDLLDRLERDRGLDVTAVTNEFDQHLRDLVKTATAPVVSDRIKSFLPTSATPGDTPVRVFVEKWDSAAGQDDTRASSPQMDAAAPMIDGKIADRFVVKQVLGSGSTALGILVEDTDDPDGPPKVLKVGRDDQAAARLRGEAEVLRSLAKGLPAKYSKLFVSLLADPMVVHNNRTCLVLSSCGTVTLAGALQLGPVAQSRFWKFAANLADMLVALEAAGVAHRDIKPSNLGIRRPGKNAHLALFDFSASRESLHHTEVGTGAYRDPFLGRHGRRTADSAAERYAAGVVLFEMATGSTPTYGDGLTDPSLTDGRVAIDQDTFPAEWSDEVVDAMTAIFHRLLDGDVRSRYGSAEEFRDALATATSLYGGDQERSPRHASPTTEATNATVIGRDVTARRGDTLTATTVALPGMGQLADELLAQSGSSRTSDYKLVRAILGLADDSPADPFQAMSAFAETLRVTQGRIPQITGKFPDLWKSSPLLRDSFEAICGAIHSEIVRRGGVASIRQLAAALEQLLGSDPSRSREDFERLRLGILRMFDLGLHRAADGAGSGVELIRRGRIGHVIGMTLHPEWAKPLASEVHQAARDLLQEPGVQVVSPELVDQELGSVATSVLSKLAVSRERVGIETLRELAVAGDPDMSINTAGELYSTHIEVRDLISLTLPQAAREFSLELLSDSIRARFPQLASRAPRRDDVEAVLSEAMPGMAYDSARRVFRYFSDTPAGLSAVLTRTPSSHRTRVGAGEDPVVEQLSRALSGAGFVSVSVPYGRSDEIADQLAMHVGGQVVDLSDKVLGRLDEALIASGQESKRDEVLQLAPDQLRPVMETHVRSVLDEVDALPDPVVVLTEASLLAGYSQLDQLSRWTNLSAPPQRPVVLITSRPTDAPGQPDQVEGRQLPITSDSQLVSV
ncbi:protein kinase domain-containing protein [Dietzia massiliensis]|uniref:protein kinase domain-containing protein n=1 Tax=Dietzia massiliensis TaxID=2697499 RepID=UPI001BCFE35A|nr:NERD domain-containing protein [Dietzia massiliensis]MBS7546546.1 protein kinase [Dietzia massiliensis]